MCGVTAQTLGHVISSGGLTSVHGILADIVMLCGINYLPNDTDDTSEMTKNKKKQNIKLSEKHNWAHFSRGSMHMFEWGHKSHLKLGSKNLGESPSQSIKQVAGTLTESHKNLKSRKNNTITV